MLRTRLYETGPSLSRHRRERPLFGDPMTDRAVPQSRPERKKEKGTWRVDTRQFNLGGWYFFED